MLVEDSGEYCVVLDTFLTAFPPHLKRFVGLPSILVILLDASKEKSLETHFCKQFSLLL